MAQKKQTKVPDQDATYLRANYLTMTVPKMAKALGRGTQTVYDFMELLKLEPLARKIPTTHPFKRKNRQLETLFLGRRIQNSPKNKNPSI